MRAHSNHKFAHPCIGMPQDRKKLAEASFKVLILGENSGVVLRQKFQQLGFGKGFPVVVDGEWGKPQRNPAPL